MTRTIMTNFFLLCILIQGSFLFSGTASSSESHRQEETWSFAFDNFTLSEALSQIAEKTRMQIVLAGDSDKIINSSYENQNIEEIMKDLLFDINHVMSMSQGDNGKDVIKIWLVGKSSTAEQVVDAENFITFIPPEPEKREGLESPPSPPGVPMPRK